MKKITWKPPFWTNIPTAPPPPCGFFLLLFKTILRAKINILATVKPENKFSGRAYAENK